MAKSSASSNPIAVEAGAGAALRDRTFFLWNGALSAAALLFLVWVVYLRRVSPSADAALAFLPAVNAALNGASALALGAGYIAIRARRPALHRACMLSALVFSALFLTCYLIYHGVHGDTRFLGQGAVRPVYFAILISHILLSAVILPLVATTLYFALGRRFDRHRAIARITLPIWLYVSVTGVLIFVFLKVYG